MPKDNIAKRGHNRTGGVAVEQLKSVIERYENLQEEKQGIADDQRAVLAEAKANGFDVKAIKEIIKQRRQDAAEREEFEAMLGTYQRALGMIPELDL